MSAVKSVGATAAALALGLFVCGAALGPALLPYLPGRAFSVKGAVLGSAAFGAAALLWPGLGVFGSWLHAAAWALFAPAFASFIVMNFTGASTYTSLSGVLREMRFALPMQIAGAVIGSVLWVIGLFASGGFAI
jgi:acetyl-CoA decarbonylase/synthase complex subunit gamma